MDRAMRSSGGGRSPAVPRRLPADGRMRPERVGESFQQGTVWASETAWALKIAHWRERVKVTEALKSLYSRGNQNCRMSCRSGPRKG
jgi:hypothetical protein